MYKITKEEVNRIRKLRESGMKIKKIADTVGYSDTTVRRYLGGKEVHDANTQSPRMNRLSWQAHCETCLYAFRKSIKSNSTYLSCGCELEVADPVKCGRWLDTERIMPIPEWIYVEDDLPVSQNSNRSITVKVRLSNGAITNAYYSDKYKKWYLHDGKNLPKKVDVVKWRSKEE